MKPLESRDVRSAILSKAHCHARLGVENALENPLSGMPKVQGIRTRPQGFVRAESLRRKDRR